MLEFALLEHDDVNKQAEGYMIKYASNPIQAIVADIAINEITKALNAPGENGLQQAKSNNETIQENL